jgi:hypothetical protein
LTWNSNLDSAPFVQFVMASTKGQGGKRTNYVSKPPLAIISVSRKGNMKV